MKYYRNWMQEANVSKIFIALDGKARFVGGCVRDAVLNKKVKDIDIATPLFPEEVIEKLGKYKIKVIPTGIKHGTVTAIINKKGYEITTLRQDIDCFGRHAEVKFTDNWQEDAIRRDFTINAMFATQNGEVFDYFGGIEDLMNKNIRFVGDAKQRCKEDYLRILRFFRFLTRYGKDPADKEALIACKLYAPNIKTLSGERIQVEMFKILESRKCYDSLLLMQETGVMGQLIPGDINLPGLKTLLKFTKIRYINAITNLAVLIGDNDKIKKEVASSWKLSKKDSSLLMFVSQNLSIDKRNIKKLILDYDFISVLCLAMWQYANNKIDSDILLEIDALKNWQAPKLPIDGNDLIKLGLASKGPSVGIALKKAKQLWLDSDFSLTKNSLIKILRKGYGS